MGKLYTTNFASIKKIDNDSIIISVARYNPSWLRNDNISYWYKSLAPSEQLLNDYKHNGIDWIEYERRYKEQIALGGRLVKRQLNNIKNLVDSDNDVYLVCYEKSSDNCHRHILREILSSMGCSGHEKKF